MQVMRFCPLLDDREGVANPATGPEEAFMEGEFDRKRRRAKMIRFSWAKRLKSPVTIQLAVALVVGITKVISALYELYCKLRN